MNDFIVTLTARELICENTILFSFDTSSTGFKFEAGQYAHFTIIDPAIHDEKGHSRPLSIASSPNHKNFILIAARTGSSVFVDNLSKVQLGSKVYVSKPAGSLILKDGINLPKVFLAGGTGITPVRSIIEKFVQDRSAEEIFLFYSNRSESQTSFLKDFEKWAAENKNFKFVPLILDQKNKNWKYQYGLINSELLKMHLMDFRDKIYYLTGPPKMVDSLKEFLLREKVPREKIRFEKFT